ncbi:hypothetical protein OS187_12370 [Xanthomonadaceae bacterium JHOS43]|nr:hypothetical protein [Xanthomonadaceae bacterium JHOS43]MCX7564478.1 hypothetical protein [Xanthomonadaceae bacterium XH05]
MTPARWVAVALSACLVVALAACTNEAPPVPEDEHKSLQRAIQQPLDKARAVEDEVRKQQESVQRQLDEAGG